MKSCSGCNDDCPCIDDGNIICAKCGTLCFNGDCYSRHVGIGGNCTVLQESKCSKCLVNISKSKSEVHKCFIKYCSDCKEEYQVTPHTCYVVPLERQKLIEEDKTRRVFVFVDIETRQDTPIASHGDTFITKHTPTLVVAHVLCDDCIDVGSTNKKVPQCESCGVEEHFFEGDQSVTMFGNWLYNNLAISIRDLARRFREKIVIMMYAHNLQKFDGHFILQDLWLRDFEGVKIIMSGRKIMMIKFANIKMVDSLSLFQQPLSALPASFGFKNIVKKGFFPFLADTKLNGGKGLVKMPPLKDFGIKFMKEKQAEELLSWYKDNENKLFNLEKERLEYCRSDVEILRRAVLTYRQSFKDITEIDPLTRRFTLPSIGT